MLEASRKTYRSYAALLRTSFASAVEYRAQVIIWVLSGIFPLVMMAVWLAVVAEAGPITGWGQADFISYYVAAALVNHITFNWVIWDWEDEIQQGNLSIKLLKPIDPVHQLVLNQVGLKMIVLLVLVPAFILVTWLSPDIHYPVDPAHLAVFLVSVASGFLLSTFMASAFGMISFWSTQSTNLYSFWIGVGQFLSGWIAPLAMFPAGVRDIASWLPFHGLLGFPVEILTGRLTWTQIAFGLAVTLFWMAFFLGLYRFLWHRGLRRYEGVGS